MTRAFLCCLAAIGLTGCLYSRANISYAANPELAPLRFSAGISRARVANIGMVQVTLSEETSCDELAVHALKNLLAEAQAIGGVGVEEVQFRGRFSWLGQPVCRGRYGEKTVHVRGFAVKSQ